MERLISPSALQFKGTGWYVTDYARSGSNGGGKSESKPSDGSESAGAGKTESKSESSTAPSKPAATE